MAATLNIDPELVNLSQNPVYFNWSCGKYVTASGLQAFLQIYLTAGVAAAQAFDLKWGPPGSVTNLIFTADASPDDSGDQFTAYVSGTVEDYTLALIEEMNQNYELYSAFEITYAGLIGPSSEPTINIQAREKGTDYSITVNGLPTNVVQNTNIPGVDPTWNEKFTLRVGVEMETAQGSNEYAEIMAVELVPDSSSIVKFDAQRIIHSQLSPYIPAANLATIQTVDDVIQRFRLKYGEKYGDPQDIKRLDTAGPYFVLMGALDPVKFTQVDFYPDLIQTDQMFLSWHPGNKITGTATPEFLFWLNGDAAITSIELNVEVTFADGTTATDTPISKSGTTEGECFCIPVGHDALSLDALGTTDVMEYDVWLKDQLGNDISPVFTFIMDRDQRIADRSFGFVNSLGAFEVIRCVGSQTEGMKIEGQLAEKILAPDYEAQDGEMIQFDKSAQEEKEIYVGILTRDEVIAMKGLFLSAHTYILDGSDWVPVFVSSNQVNLSDDLTDLYPFSFKYMVAYNKKGHSA